MPTNILIVDDDHGYVDAIYQRAKKKDITLTHAECLEEAQELIRKNEILFLSGVILDVKCKVRKDEPDHVNSFIASYTYFKSDVPYLPLAILTGYMDILERFKDLLRDETIYRKLKDEDKMLDFLKKEASNLPQRKIMYDYRVVIRITEGKYFDGDGKEDLMDALLNMDKADMNSIKGTLSSVRSLQEKMFVALNRFDDQMVPSSILVNNGIDDCRIDFKKIMDHLKGNWNGSENRSKVYLHHESNIIRKMYFIHRTCSHGIHAIQKDKPDKPTIYTVYSVIFAMMDLLLWFEKYVKGNYREE